MGHTHRYKFGLKKNQVKSPSIWSHVPELGSDLPIGSDRESGHDSLTKVNFKDEIFLSGGEL